MNNIDPNWIMAICAICTLVGGFIVWLSITFADIRFIKREVIKLSVTKHRILNILNYYGLRIALLETHLNIKPPEIEDEVYDNE
jgi:hypothetical protein